jgi:hypothetical protein
MRVDDRPARLLGSPLVDVCHGNVARVTIDTDGGAPSPRLYRAATLGVLADWLSGRNEQMRWQMVAEFLEEFGHEPAADRADLLAEEPASTGDERWDVFVAALAEHLSARDSRAAPGWCQTRALRRFWFPFNTPAARADAIVHAPAAFRRRGVFIAPQEVSVA